MVPAKHVTPKPFITANNAMGEEVRTRFPERLANGHSMSGPVPEKTGPWSCRSADYCMLYKPKVETAKSDRQFPGGLLNKNLCSRAELLPDLEKTLRNDPTDGLHVRTSYCQEK